MFHRLSSRAKGVINTPPDRVIEPLKYRNLNKACVYRMNCSTSYNDAGWSPKSELLISVLSRQTPGFACIG
jgi:hypothetical protein